VAPLLEIKSLNNRAWRIIDKEKPKVAPRSFVEKRLAYRHLANTVFGQQSHDRHLVSKVIFYYLIVDQMSVGQIVFDKKAWDQGATLWREFYWLLLSG
jgi:hypothetical protein